jgi:hypothetical protein
MIIVLGLSIFIINLLVLARDSREGFETPTSCFEFTSAVNTNMFSTDISGVKKSLEKPIDDFKLKIKDGLKKAMDGIYTDAEFYNEYLNEYKSINDDELKEWLDTNVVNVNNYSTVCTNKKDSVDKKETDKKETDKKDSMDKKESLKNEFDDVTTLKETEENDKKLSNMFERVKDDNPDLDESLKVLKGVDMNELNKLLNKLNEFTDSFSGKKST